VVQVVIELKKFFCNDVNFFDKSLNCRHLSFPSI
jgi:hypothetical protein